MMIPVVSPQIKLQYHYDSLLLHGGIVFGQFQPDKISSFFFVNKLLVNDQSKDITILIEYWHYWASLSLWIVWLKRSQNCEKLNRELDSSVQF